MIRRRTIRAAPEAWLARAALHIVPRLSRQGLFRLSTALGSAAFYLGGVRTRRVAEANLQLVFPDLSDAERKRILKRSLQTFAQAMLEVFWLGRDAEQKLPDLVDFDPSYEVLFKPGPAICVTAHIGNWEALGMALSLRAGDPLVSVAATIKNKRVDELFVDLRRATGQEIVPRKGAVRSLLRALRNGRKIALVLDQNTKPVEGGIFVDFLGLPAPVSTAPALLALRTGAPIYVGAALPMEGGRYRTRPLVNIPAERGAASEREAIRAITQKIADELSALIREHPEAWVWSYKRWKIRPPGAQEADYPFYSRPLHKTDLPRGREADGGT